ncbi:deoxyribonuclease IV [bacterium]|nr:deoxyribonuclease IV [bacterium]
MPNDLLGAHISITGGINIAIEKAKSIGCTAIQIFTSNPRSWNKKLFSEDEKKLFTQSCEQSGIREVVAHSSYLLNIASTDKLIQTRSKNFLQYELERCESLSINTVVVHPGSKKETADKQAFAAAANAINYALEKNHGKTSIAIETMAGQGSQIGARFEELKEIYERIENKSRVVFCMDTAHIHASGYSIGTKETFNKVLKQFDKILSLNKLKIIHMNDSKTACGSKSDRHEKIGQGTIGLEAFDAIMNNKLLEKIPKILETPVHSLQEYGEELKLLRSLKKA